MKKDLGFTQIFWGNGKGKTTAALGTALRACGNNYNVHLIQFNKNGTGNPEIDHPGEIKALEKFDNFSYKRFGSDGWIIGKPKESQISATKEALMYTKEALESEKYHIIIADEILYAIQLGLLTEQDVIDLINTKPANTELILTGSHKPYLDIFEKAQLVTEIKKIKHPFDEGIMARKGLEY